MKNLKTAVVLFTVSFFAGNLFAQEEQEKRERKAYVSVYGGYGFKMGSQNIPNFYNAQATQADNNYTSTTEQVNVSLGQGFNFGGMFGYMFNRSFGVELGVSYLFGDKTTATAELHNVTNSWGTQTGINKHSLSAKMLRINPSLIVASGLKKRFNPYAKFGLVVGFGSITREGNSNYNTNGNEEISVSKIKFDGGVALGLSSGIGATFNVGKKISLFGECTILNMSYAPTKGVLTEFTYNGKDQLHTLTTREKETEYVNKRFYELQQPRPDSEPSKGLKEKYPFGSVGLNIGVRISL